MTKSDDVPVFIGTVADVASGWIDGYAHVNALQGETVIHGRAYVYDRPGGSLRLRVHRAEGGAVCVSITGEDLAAAQASDDFGTHTLRGLPLARKVAVSGPVVCAVDGAR